MLDPDEPTGIPAPASSEVIFAAAQATGWSHRHRDVSGGWLRPTVFGAVDGLVTNAALIAGVGGGGVSAHAIVLTGLAGLVAGAFSMGTGEYVSVTNQNELVHAEVAVERRTPAEMPEAEQGELQNTFSRYGVDDDTAGRMAAAVSRDPENALRLHTREELGVDQQALPSAVVTGVASRPVVHRPGDPAGALPAGIEQPGCRRGPDRGGAGRWGFAGGTHHRPAADALRGAATPAGRHRGRGHLRRPAHRLRSARPPQPTAVPL